jgi:uridine kinase
MGTIGNAVSLILSKRALVSPRRALFVAVSGIDGSGKGFITEQIIAHPALRARHVCAINIDGWLQLPNRRFSKERPADHFYENGVRFQEMFERLVLPLKEHRSLRLEADLADATNAAEYRRHVYQFDEVDIVILEGIFLLKVAFRGYYDLALWVDCTFETALERALGRGQEGLCAAETMRDYERIYFAAQRIHFAKDAPRAAADLIIDNDAYLVHPG